MEPRTSDCFATARGKGLARDVLKGQAAATLETTISAVAGQNRLTAYAFNRDNVKSTDATLAINGADSLRRAATLHLLAVA